MKKRYYETIYWYHFYKLGHIKCKSIENLISYGQIPFSDLMFTKRISKNSEYYSDRKTIENCILKILTNNDKLLRAGEEIKYIIIEFDRKIVVLLYC